MRSNWWLPCAGMLALLGACATLPPTSETEPPRRPTEEPPRRDEPPADAVVVGAILSETGSGALQQYAELVRQGIDIALREEAGNGGRDVRLLALDDAGDPARAAGLVAELEARGAVAIIGPLLNQSVEAAGRARDDASIVIVSPTSSDPPARLENVYTLNAGDSRGAEALGAYAARGGARIGVLYPDAAAFRAQAEVFRAAAEAAGTSLAATVPFLPGTTTFARPLERLRAAAVHSVFIPATERDIRQLAPQLEYYGLGSVEVLGLEAWVSDEVLNFLPSRALEGVVAATPLYRASPTVAWDHFVGLYEATYRRTLDNPYPALGYDAARLVLASLPAGRVRPADVARGIAAVDDFRGATGVLSTRGGHISRKPFIVRIQSGRPVLEPGS